MSHLFQDIDFSRSGIGNSDDIAATNRGIDDARVQNRLANVQPPKGIEHLPDTGKSFIQEEGDSR